MKKSLVVAILVAAVVAAGCEKNGPEKETYTAELTSVSVLAEDNAELISEDIEIPVESSMAVRLSGGGRDKELVLTLVAGKDDAIFIDEEKVIGGKAKIDASFPVDIIVRDTVGNITTAYELKVKNTVGMTIDLVNQYVEENCAAGMEDRLGMAAAPNGDVYITYMSTATVDGVKQKQNLSVIKWDGTAVSQVGKAGFVDVSSNPVSYPISVKVNSKGNPVVMYSGGLVKGLISVMEFNGGNWNFIGTDKGVSQKFSVAYGTPQFYFNPKTGNPGFFYMCSTSKTDPNYRNYTEASYNGSDWSLDFGSLGDFPKYSDGSIFYMAAACNTKDVAWIVTSCNQKGYYVYKKTDSSWECVVNNFVPEGEPYGVPSNLSIKADADGNVYVFAAHSSAAKMQLYKVNEAGKSLDIYGNAFVCTPGSSGAIKDQASFDISEKGQFVAVVADKFYVLNADKQWEFANNLYMPGTLGKYSSYFMEFTGAESGVFTTTLDDAEGNTSICIYKFGPEE